MVCFVYESRERGREGGSGEKCVERTLEPVGHLFNIQHQKDFLFIQKEILRWRIHLKIFDIFKKYKIFEGDNSVRPSVESGTIYKRGI